MVVRTMTHLDKRLTVNRANDPRLGDVAEVRELDFHFFFRKSSPPFIINIVRFAQKVPPKCKEKSKRFGKMDKIFFSSSTTTLSLAYNKPK